MIAPDEINGVSWLLARPWARIDAGLQRPSGARHAALHRRAGRGSIELSHCMIPKLQYLLAYYTTLNLDMFLDSYYLALSVS